jgi:type II secretory pathway component PulJ
MGSSTMLDLIGSIVIGGFLLVMGLRINAQASEASNVYAANLILQQNITAVVSILEEDFKKIGYCKDWRKIPDPSKALRIAEASRIRFWTDVDNDGTLDSITYYVGSPIQLLSTPNPRDRFLYRQVNKTAPISMNLGVTQFAFKFSDAENDPLAFPITDPRLVYYMQISLAVESGFPLTQEYMADTTQYEVFWRQLRLITKNLRNR